MVSMSVGQGQWKVRGKQPIKTQLMSFLLPVFFHPCLEERSLLMPDTGACVGNKTSYSQMKVHGDEIRRKLGSKRSARRSP